MDWVFAKQKLPEDVPDGTCVWCNDHLSFIRKDGLVLAMGRRLGTGSGGQVKLAYTEQGALYALKIMPVDRGRDPQQEAAISQDLRLSSGPLALYKEHFYLLGPYLGVTLAQHMRRHRDEFANVDHCLAFATKLCTLVHDLHCGRLSQSGNRYTHNDLHRDNIMVDEKGTMTLIDMGHAQLIDPDDLFPLHTDMSFLSQLLCKLFAPWRYDYLFFIQSGPLLKIETGKWTVNLFVRHAATASTEASLSYSLLDPHEALQEGAIDTREIGFEPPWGEPLAKWKLTDAQFDWIKEQVLEDARERGFIFRPRADINEVLDNPRTYLHAKQLGDAFGALGALGAANPGAKEGFAR